MSNFETANEPSTAEQADPKTSIFFQEAFSSQIPDRQNQNKTETDLFELFVGFDDKGGKSANSQLLELPFVKKEKVSPKSSALEKSMIVAPKPQVPAPQAAHALGVKEFVEESQKLLPRLDLDKNGTVSPAELSKAIVNPDFRGVEAQTLAFLHTVQTLSTPDSFLSKQRAVRTPGHPVLGSPEGVTKDTLNQIKEMKLAFNTNVWAGQGGLSSYDANKDGSISRAELEQKNINFDKMASLLGADVVIAKDKDPAQDRFSIPDVVSKIHKENEKAQSKALNNFSLNALELASERLSKSSLSDKLYGTPENPTKSIVPGAIKQGLNQNCLFLSTLASVANSNPDTIAKMIELNPDGKTFTVKFPGDPQNKITVPIPTEAELRLSSEGGKHGYWANVLESAFGKHLQTQRKLDPDLVPMMAGFTHVDKGFSQTQKDSFQLLTGKKLLFAQFTQEVSLPDLADIIKDGISCSANTPGDPTPTTRDGYTKQHAYTILSFDPKGSDSGTVKLRNPIGEDGITRDSKSGISTLSVKDFKANFTTIFLPGPELTTKPR